VALSRTFATVSSDLSEIPGADSLLLHLLPPARLMLIPRGSSVPWHV